jgi:16S rRNA (guanine527-N7)-methyltransferase
MKRPEEILQAGAGKLGLTLHEEHGEAFSLYLSELKKWSRAYSLTSLRTDEDIVIKHFLDSFLYLTVLPDDIRSLADVGSGAGFPGLPIKILMPHVRVFLIEPSGKKAAFLRNIIRKLGLSDIRVLETRIEDVRDIEVDVAVTRALFRADEFEKKASHVVRKGGLLVMNKGPKAGSELAGLAGVEVREVALPLTNIKRNLVVIRP